MSLLTTHSWGDILLQWLSLPWVIEPSVSPWRPRSLVVVAHTSERKVTQRSLLFTQWAQTLFEEKSLSNTHHMAANTLWNVFLIWVQSWEWTMWSPSLSWYTESHHLHAFLIQHQWLILRTVIKKNSRKTVIRLIKRCIDDAPWTISFFWYDFITVTFPLQIIL